MRTLKKIKFENPALMEYIMFFIRKDSFNAKSKFCQICVKGVQIENSITCMYVVQSSQLLL